MLQFAEHRQGVGAEGRQQRAMLAVGPLPAVAEVEGVLGQLPREVDERHLATAAVSFQRTPSSRWSRRATTGGGGAPERGTGMRELLRRDWHGERGTKSVALTRACGSGILSNSTNTPGPMPSHWRDCHFADATSPSLLKHLLKVEGGAAE